MNPITTTPTQQRHFRVPFSGDIQGLRALAVLLVVFFHAGYGNVNGGFVGVDVFFVISGYLIGGILFDSVYTSTPQNRYKALVTFWARRVRRLLPQALLVILVTYFLAIMYTPVDFLEDVKKDALASLFYVANYAFSFSAQDYFMLDRPQSPFLHFWSLSIEEQFYIGFPIILLGFSFLRLRLRTIIITLGALSVVSLVSGIFKSQTQQTVVFYQTEFRVWELSAGVILAAIAPKIRSRFQQSFASQFLLYLSLTAILLSGLFMREFDGFPAPLALIPTSATITALICLAAGSSSLLLSNPVAQWIGDRSYAFYLWHWPVLYFGPTLVPGSSFQIEFCLLALLVLTIVSFSFIENPIRNSQKFARFNGRTLILAFGSMLLSIWVISQATALSKVRQTISEEMVASYNDQRKILPESYADDCHLNNEYEPIKDCLYGPKNADHTIWLFGDSHAAQWLPVFNSAASNINMETDQSLNIRAVTKSSCPSVDIPIWHKGYKSNYISCEAWKTSVLEQIKMTPINQRPIIVLTNDTDYLGWITADNMIVTDPSLATNIYQTGLQSMIKKLTELNVRVVLVGDTPKAYDGYWDCILADGKTCDRTKRSALAHMAWQEKTARNLGVDYIDLNQALCPSATCPVIIDNIMVYRDSTHISVPMILTLTDLLEFEIRELLDVNAN